MNTLPHIALTALFLSLPAAAQAATCSDYADQKEANEALRRGAYELDRDRDGQACEHLPKGQYPHEPYFEQIDIPKTRTPAVKSERLTCASFATRQDAQKAYQTGERHLDANRNGKACDSGGYFSQDMSSMTTTCADYTTQEQAQSALLSGLDHLDRDRDGLACEHLPSQTGNDAINEFDGLGKPSFKWQQNDLGVQPRASRSFTTWPSH